jgi:hypothetical protein
MNLRRALARKIQQVGFNDVELREDDIERRHEDTTERLSLEIRPHHAVQIPDNRLMFRVR